MSADLPSPDARAWRPDDDVAEAATHAFFRVLQEDADPRAEHDLGGVSAIWHLEEFDAIVEIARRIMRDYCDAAELRAEARAIARAANRAQRAEICEAAERGEIPPPPPPRT